MNREEETESQVLESSLNEGKRPGEQWMSVIMNFTVNIFLSCVFCFHNVEDKIC